jgi:hypothetical protein
MELIIDSKKDQFKDIIPDKRGGLVKAIRIIAQIA